MNTLSSDAFDLHEHLEKCKTHSYRVISVSERLEETLHQISGIDPISELYLLSVTSNKLIRIWEEAAEALNICRDDLISLFEMETVKISELEVMNNEIKTKLLDLQDRYKRIYGEK